MQRKLSTSMIINEDGTYLENYLSTVGELPNDVKRSLAVVKELDLLISVKLSAIKTLTQDAICAPPLGEARNELTKSIRLKLTEVEALSEEKKSLVTQSIDLVDGHKKTLELVLEKFGKEIGVNTANAVFSIFKPKLKRKKPITPAASLASTMYPPKKKSCEGSEKSVVLERKSGVTKEKSDEKVDKRKSSSSGSKRKEEKKPKETKKLVKREEIEEEEGEEGDKGEEEKKSGANTNDKKIHSKKDSNSEYDEDEDKNLYCFCQRMSYGSMIKCDNPRCKYQWFHFECLGITSAPKGKWYCPECKKKIKKKR